MPIVINRVGKKYGTLTVIAKGESRKRPDGHGTMLHWVCQCDCGRTVEVETQNLKRNGSCGCEKKQRIGRKNRTHGHTVNGNESPEYKSWKGMIARCKNPRHRCYEHVKVCERWLTFENFLADMGPQPEGRPTLDRLDNYKGYEPGNVRWATLREQATNQRRIILYTHNGKTLCVAEWERELGYAQHYISQRLDRGMTFEEAIQPKRKLLWEVTVEILKETGNPCVQTGDSRLLQLIANRAGYEGEGPTVEAKVIAALGRQHGVLIKDYVPGRTRSRVRFSLP